MVAPRLAYLCFDVVPSPKGASVHIEAFASRLARGNLDLVTVAPTDVTEQVLGQFNHVALPALGRTLIDRILYFRQQLKQWLQGKRYDAIQIRSIYEGFPIALNKQRFCNFLVFEVNGLPSIELKYRYPEVPDDRELVHKLIAQEQICLDAADLVITPSHITQKYLVQRGVAAAKIRVIPNGVNLSTFSYQPPRAALVPPLQLLYFGTLSSWQGVSIAIEALGLYCRDLPAQLTVVAPSRPAQVAALQKLSFKLGVSAYLKMLEPVSQAELALQMHQADMIVAPLTANDRNLVQGCCPLKVLEGMASGTPVITSDLPVIHELGNSGEHFLAVQPGSAKAIQAALLQLQGDSNLRQRIAIAARQQIEQYYTWEKAGLALVEAYADLGLCLLREDVGIPP